MASGGPSLDEAFIMAAKSSGQLAVAHAMPVQTQGQWQGQALSGDGYMNINVMGAHEQGNGGLGWANDAIDRSTNLFSQLDTMLAAVQTESSALDSMRERVKELDGLRVQLSTITKRLLESDQSNLTLKSSLFQLQEAFNDLRRQKQEL